VFHDGFHCFCYLLAAFELQSLEIFLKLVWARLLEFTEIKNVDDKGETLLLLECVLLAYHPV
jgi:hypothetical protein